MLAFLNKVYKASALLSCLSLASMAAIVLLQVIFNVIDFFALKIVGKSFGFLIPSYSLFAGYALGFTTFFALAYGLRRSSHIRVTLLEQKCSVRVQFFSLTIVSLIGTVISAIIVYSLGVLTYESFLWDDRASGLIRVPLWIPQAGLLLGAIVFFIANLHTLIEMIFSQNSQVFSSHSTSDEVA